MADRRGLPIGKARNAPPSAVPAEDARVLLQPTTRPDASSERVVVVNYEEERVRRLSWNRRFMRSAKAAAAKPGFTAWLLSVTLVSAAVLFVSLLTPWWPLQLMLFVVVITADLLLFRRSLKRAFEPARVAPEGITMPTEGLPKLRYFLHRLYGRADLVPQINAKQQAKEDARAEAERQAEEALRTREAAKLFQRRTALLEERIRQIFALGVHPTIWIGNQKGTSSKSFMAVNFGNILSELLRSVVLLMSASTSTQSATAGNLAGLKGATLTVRGYYRLIDGGSRNVSFHQLYLQVNNTPHGLFVVSEDTSTDEKANFSAERWNRVYGHARENCSVIILDTGNDDAYHYTVTTRGMRKADVVVIPANVAARQTLGMTGTTLGYYLALARRSANSPIPPVSIPANGEEMSLLRKLRQPIVVFNGVDPDGDLQPYREQLEAGMEETKVTDNDDVHPIVFGVRYDDYLFHTVKGLDYTLMDPATYQDYLVVLAAVFETAAANRGVVIPECDELIRDVGLRIP